MPDHATCRDWLGSVINADDSFGMADIVLSGFVRVVTPPRIFSPPSPVGATDLRLCVYDETAGLRALATDVVIPGGGTCGTRACWQRIGPADNARGYRYKGRGFSDAGIRKVSIRAANVPKARLLLRGRGGALPLPGPVSASAYFVQDPSVTVQMVTSHGLCWDAVYTAGPTTKNRSERFRDHCTNCP